MLPDHVLSTIQMGDQIIGARADKGTNTLNYEDGGIALNDPTEGHDYQVWTGSLLGDDIILSSPLTTDEIIYTDSGITEFSFTFDQNMNPVLAFVQNGVAKLRWYDATVGTQVVTEIGANTVTPKVLYDDKRVLEDSTSDVILAYILERDVGGTIYKDLYYREQRDRFLISYLLKEDVGGDLLNIGMGDNLRVVFETIID